MYKHISDNNLLSPNQSGFRTGDSCINQLLSITYDIFHCFDEGMETRAIFLDISKAFDKVWHKGLIYKLRQYGFTGNLLALLTDFLSNRKQRVVLNGQHSSWADIKAGVPQGSILGPLLFLVYINDLTENLHSNPKLFADDTSLFSIVADEALSNSYLNDDLKKINDWAYKWKMSFNPDSTKPAHEVVFSRKKNIHYPPILFNNLPVKRVQFHRHLGLTLDSQLNFNEHISSTLSIVNKLTAVFRKLQTLLPRRSLLTIYKAFIRPHVDYSDVMCDKIFNESYDKKLESDQYNAALATTWAIRGTNTEKLCQELALESLRNRRKLTRLNLFYKIYKDQSPL